jgi:2-polyprenyl-6-methoxyphenol hydroxylase-like FAD-dependent oxidoreductase
VWPNANDHSTIHRVDYHRILAETAQRLGGHLRFGCDVVGVDCHPDRPQVKLWTGETLKGDIVIGANGILPVLQSRS